MLLLFLLTVLLACHLVCFKSEMKMLSFTFFSREFLGGCCYCLSFDFLQLFTLHLPFCKFFALFSRGFAFLFKVDSFVCRGQIGYGDRLDVVYAAAVLASACFWNLSLSSSCLLSLAACACC